MTTTTKTEYQAIKSYQALDAEEFYYDLIDEVYEANIHGNEELKKYYDIGAMETLEIESNSHLQEDVKIALEQVVAHFNELVDEGDITNRTFRLIRTVDNGSIKYRITWYRNK